MSCVVRGRPGKELEEKQGVSLSKRWCGVVQRSSKSARSGQMAAKASAGVCLLCWCVVAVVAVVDGVTVVVVELEARRENMQLVSLEPLAPSLPVAATPFARQQRGTVTATGAGNSWRYAPYARLVHS